MFCEMFTFSVFYVDFDIKDKNYISEQKDSYLKIGIFLLVITI